MSQRATQRLVLLVGSGLAGACGGGGGTAAVGDSSPPTVQVDFPPPHALTNERQITLRGTASDPDSLLRVSVGGVVAQTKDGFAHWSAVVPLADGANSIAVDVVDGRGRPTRAAARVEVTSTVVENRPNACALDAARDRLLILDDAAIDAVDLATGDEVVLSDATHGGGPLLSGLGFGLDVDADGDAALVFGSGGLLAVDLSTGDRRLVSGSGVGSGPDLHVPVGLAFDPAARRAFVTDLFAGKNGSNALLSVDVANGKRTIVSDDATGSGPALDFVFGVAGIPGDAVVVVARFSSALVRIDLATGDRTILSDATHGTGPAFSDPLGVVARSDGSAAFVFDPGLRAVVAVDLVTGRRAIVSDATRGSGPRLLSPGGGAFRDASEQSLIATDDLTSTLLAVDLATGDRSDVERDSIGSGTPFELVEGMVLDPAGGRAFVTQLLTTGLFAVDLATGARTTLSDADHGSGPAFVVTTKVGPGATPGELVVLDGNQGALLTVDEATGARAILSDATHGSGPTFFSTRSFVSDRARGLGFVGDEIFVGSNLVGRLIAVDLASGDRFVVSDDTRGSGPLLGDPIDLELDSERNRMLVLDGDAEAVVAVDLVSGDRTVLSGGGIPFADPRRLALDAAHGRVLVIEAPVRGDGVVAVDLATGDRELLVEFAGRALVPLNPRDFELTADGRRALLVDGNLHALVQIDLETGESALLSR